MPRGVSFTTSVSRATLPRSGGETSSIVGWSAPTSRATVIPSLLSRHEDRFHDPALPNRLESLGGLLERILREQGTRVYITASQQVQGRLVVCVVARVAEQQAELSAHRGGR